MQNEVAINVQTIPTPAPYQVTPQTSEKSNSGIVACCGGGFGVLLVLGVISLSLMVFITTIIMLAEGGWSGVQENCSTSMRDTLLAFIILQYLLGGSGAKSASKKEGMIVGGVIMLITFGVLSSINTAHFSMRSDTCHAYLTSTSGVNSPYWVVINQQIFGWIMTFISIILTIIGCLS
jgi:hypothetical protein